MRQAHTVEQVRSAEAELMARLPAGTLMQRAAHGLAHAVLDLLDGGYGRRVVLLVGSGDNGGDALHAGALLARRGCRVEAWLLSERAHAGGLAALRAAGGRVVQGVPEATARAGETPPTSCSTASSGSAASPGCDRRRSRRWTRWPAYRWSRWTCPPASASTPASSTGRHVRAALTVTFGTHKVAHLVDPAAAASGVVQLVDIGLDLPAPELEALQPHDVARLLPRPAPDAHKYTRGVVGIRAGSARYPGAAVLSVAGAATGLCGMVRVVGDPAVTARVREAHPEVVGAGRVQAWVVGSGGDARAAEALAAASADGVPVVVDADALAHVTGPLPVPAVLTPHAGELAAMLGVERAEVEAAPLAFARRAATTYDAVVLLKGRHTLVLGPSGPGAGDDRRHPVAGHRGRRRRARRADRCAARGRPGTPRRRLGRVLAARCGRDPRLGGRTPGRRATSLGRCRRSCGPAPG